MKQIVYRDLAGLRQKPDRKINQGKDDRVLKEDN